MFWKAIFQGLALAVYPQVVAASVGYLIVLFGTLGLVNYIKLKATGEWEMHKFFAQAGVEEQPGCLWSLFLMGVSIPLQSFALAGYMVYLLPLVLFGAQTNSLSFVLSNAASIIITGIIAAVITIVLSLLPFVGALIARSESIQVFIQGVIIFRLVSEEVLSSSFGKAALERAYPGFGACVGFLAITLVFTIVAVLTFNFAKEAVLKEQAGKMAETVFNRVFRVIAGFLPVFMYIKYVGLSLSPLVK